MSLVFGGVPKRFPHLQFAFQEGGVAWGAGLLGAVLGHYEKRNRDAIEHYNPAHLDRDLLERLFAQHGAESVVARLDRLDDGLRMLSDPADADKVDFFGESQLTGADDIVRVFTEQFFFGCEADDPMNALALPARAEPTTARGCARCSHPTSDTGTCPTSSRWCPRRTSSSRTSQITDDATSATSSSPTRWRCGPRWRRRFFDGTVVADAVARELASSRRRCRRRVRVSVLMLHAPSTRS